MLTKSLIAILLFISFDVVAKDIDDAIAAMRSGDFAEAYCIMRPYAEQGDADAQYNVGWMYLNGYGLRVNDNLALEWWSKASAQGHTEASFSIGMLYSLGEGKIRKDLNKAIDYYLLAARGGQDDAITILQSMMLRNDKAIQGRMQDILKQHASLFGIKRKVEANKLNARKGPSVEDKIVTGLLKGQVVLEMFKQGKWSQVALLDEGEGDKKVLDRTFWVYNPLLEKID